MNTILFRPGLDEAGELDACCDHFFAVTSRAYIPEGSFVVGRYSVLPHYQELERDLQARSQVLVNSYRAHRYVADLANWYEDFADVTPRTWFRPSDVPMDHPGPFVLKGATNSRKHLWDTHMYAPARSDVMTVWGRLADDSLIGDQGIYVREYEPLERVDEGVRGLPITVEYRFFALQGKVLAGGWYWSNFEDLEPTSTQRIHAHNFARGIAERVGNKCPFVVIDVARRDDGEWRLVELNDGQMSGLSCVDPEELYSNLKAALAPTRASVQEVTNG